MIESHSIWLFHSRCKEINHHRLFTIFHSLFKVLDTLNVKYFPNICCCRNCAWVDFRNSCQWWDFHGKHFLVFVLVFKLCFKLSIFYLILLLVMQQKLNLHSFLNFQLYNVLLIAKNNLWTKNRRRVFWQFYSNWHFCWDFNWRDSIQVAGDSTWTPACALGWWKIKINLTKVWLKSQ